MFTGIIEEIGTIKNIKNGNKSSKITVKAGVVLDKTILGDSISVNGVCLTVTNIGKESFCADIMAETLKRSNLYKLTVGSKVNLERALMLNKRIGGHIVSGHIDGTGEIKEFLREDNAIWVTVKTSSSILKYIVEKGSIAIDGVSLTVAYVDNQIFKVCIIPHTAEETILLQKRENELVNLECDVLGKYIEKFLKFKGVEERQENNSISQEFLKNNGFM